METFTATIPEALAKAIAYHGAGRLPAAEQLYRQIIQVAPDYADAHNHLGNLLRELGKPQEAAASYGKAISIRPDYFEAHHNLGCICKETGQLEQATAAYRRAIELNPNYAETHNDLGATLKDQGKNDEAMACYQRALALKPDLVHAHVNVGNVLGEQGKLDEALARYHHALQINPKLPEAHWSLALVWLLRGDFQSGWPEYEWRRHTKLYTPQSFPQPLWDGGPLAGRTILLHAEQGFGDTIHFIRYAPLVKRQGGTVVVQCQKPLTALLAAAPGIDRLVPQGDPLPQFDVQSPLLSLPGILGTRLETIPAEVPYLAAAPQLVQRWRERVNTLEGPAIIDTPSALSYPAGADGIRPASGCPAPATLIKIGIVWQGNRRFGADRLRSIPLEYFAALAQVPGVCLISLQKGAGTEQLAQCRPAFPIVDYSSELDVESGAFMDTAALMMNLDLVVACDTATAHLAGAIGVPVWLALRFIPDWRWLLDRSDSPWYPSMRLFRQKERGDWKGVFDEMRSVLCQWKEVRSQESEEKTQGEKTLTPELLTPDF